MEKWVTLGRTKGPFKITSYKSQLIKERDSSCQKCGKKVDRDELTLDHRIPVKVGGKDCIFKKSNLWLLCKECNNKKLCKDKQIIFEMIREGFFSKGSPVHILYKSETECVEFYTKKFKNFDF